MILSDVGCEMFNVKMSRCRGNGCMGWWDGLEVCVAAEGGGRSLAGGQNRVWPCRRKDLGDRDSAAQYGGLQGGDQLILVHI